MQPDEKLTNYFNQFSKDMGNKVPDMWAALDAARTPEERAAGIPFMDLSLVGQDPRAWGICFVASAAQNGFAQLKNHPVSVAGVNAACDSVRAFFNQSAAALEKYRIDMTSMPERGLSPYGLEVHRTVPGSDAKAGDMKAYMQFGREDLTPEEMQAHAIRPNLWPDHPADFKQNLTALEAGMHAVEKIVHRAIASGLGLEENYFLDKARYGDTIWRTNHYPVPEKAAPTGGMPSGIHTDGGLFTLLFSNRGLVVMPDLYDEKTWLRPESGAEYMVFNVGKVLDRLTRGFLPATHHMVEEVPGRTVPRVTIPRFVWLGHNEKIEEIPCLPPLDANRSRREVTEKLIREYPAGTPIRAYKGGTLGRMI